MNRVILFVFGFTVAVAMSSMDRMPSGCVDITAAESGDSSVTEVLERWQELGVEQQQLLREGKIIEAATVADEIDLVLKSLPQPNRYNVAFALRLNEEIRGIPGRGADAERAVTDALKRQHDADRLRDDGQVGESAVVLRTSVTELVKILSEKSELVDIGRVALVDRYHELGLFKLASPVVDEVTEFRRGQYGRNSPVYAAALTMKGCTYLGLEEYEKAEAALREALTIRRQLDGSGRPYYQCQILVGRVHSALGHHVEAEALSRDALRFGSNVITEADQAIALACLGRAYVHYGEFGVAKDSLHNALAAIRRAKLANSLQAAEVLEELADSLRRLDKEKGAFEYAVEAQTIRLKIEKQANVVKEVVEAVE